MVKFQSYLAGSVFALLLVAQVAMALLNVYTDNQYLWHVNIAFDREVRPLLEHLDLLAGSRFDVGVAVLSFFAILAVIAAKQKLHLLAAGTCHIALAMVVLVAIRPFLRSYPERLSTSTGDLASFTAGLSTTQWGLIMLACLLLAMCIWSHVNILGKATKARRSRCGKGVRTLSVSTGASTAAHPFGSPPSAGA